MAAVTWQGDRIPTPVVGPHYAMDEAGIQYFGLSTSVPPVLNNGTPLVLQREADLPSLVVRPARRATSGLQVRPPPPSGT